MPGGLLTVARCARGRTQRWQPLPIGSQASKFYLMSLKLPAIAVHTWHQRQCLSPLHLLLAPSVVVATAPIVEHIAPGPTVSYELQLFHRLWSSWCAFVCTALALVFGCCKAPVPTVARAHSTDCGPRCANTNCTGAGSRRNFLLNLSSVLSRSTTWELLPFFRSSFFFSKFHPCFCPYPYLHPDPYSPVPPSLLLILFFFFSLSLSFSLCFSSTLSLFLSSISLVSVMLRVSIHTQSGRKMPRTRTSEETSVTACDEDLSDSKIGDEHRHYPDKQCFEPKSLEGS